jgi:very-short-patch-repair endonuclease
MAMRWGKLYKGTPAELALEEAVAELGVPYRTQFPGYLYGFRFFPDFLLPTLGLVIEVDDSSHKKADKILKDADRTEALEARGWQVVRCTNEEALDDPRGAVRAMLRSVGMWPLPEKKERLARALPQPGKCPAKDRRAAKSLERRRRRGNRSPDVSEPQKRSTPPGSTP